MAGAVQLVPVAQVAEPRLGRAALEVAVEIAVRLLRRVDARDDVVDHRLEFLVALCRQRVRGGLDPLADVGVPVHHRRGRLGADRRHLMGDRQRIGRRMDIERGEDAGLLVLLVQERNRGIAHRGLARRPEPVVEGNRGERHRPHRSHRASPCHFNAPAVRPATMRRCSTRNSTRIGTTNTDENAITRCQSAYSAPTKL